MTVEELRDILSDFDSDRKVYVRYIRVDRDGCATTEDYWLDEDCITIDKDDNAVIDITDDA